MKTIGILLAALAVMNTPSSGLPRTGDSALVDSTQIYYAEQDVEALQRLFARTNDRELALLCRYRLYPLTQDPVYLADLPTELENATARELALLSGLWGYRVMETSVFKVPTYGKRATRLLDEAKAIDPREPFVLLIDGQSLLFRPKIFGGDKREALVQFNKLCDVLPGTHAPGISTIEAGLWVWYTRKKMKDTDADSLRAELLAQNPPPLYKAFLLDPP